MMSIKAFTFKEYMASFFPSKRQCAYCKQWKPKDTLFRIILMCFDCAEKKAINEIDKQ